jgi:hypothetical protein
MKSIHSYILTASSLVLPGIPRPYLFQHRRWEVWGAMASLGLVSSPDLSSLVEGPSLAGDRSCDQHTVRIIAFERVCWLASNLAPLIQESILLVCKGLRLSH